MTRTKVHFYTLNNGHASLFGIGKEVKLSNGNIYAIIKGIAYKVVFDGYNNQEFIPITVTNDCMGNTICLTLSEYLSVKKVLSEVQKVISSYYPEDGSQDHVDHHIYGELRTIVAPLEENLESKYQTSICLV